MSNIIILGISGASQSSSGEALNDLIGKMKIGICTKVLKDYGVSSNFLVLKSTFFSFRKWKIKTFFKKYVNDNTLGILCIGKSLGAIKLLEYIKNNYSLFKKYFYDKKIVIITVDPHQPGFFDKDSGFIIDFNIYGFIYPFNIYNFRQVRRYPSGAFLFKERDLSKDLIVKNVVMGGEHIDHFSILKSKWIFTSFINSIYYLCNKTNKVFTMSMRNLKNIND